MQPAPVKIRILIIDDQLVVREGLRMLIEKHPGTKVVALASTRAEALASLESEAIDLIILDMELGGFSTLPFLPQLREAAKNARILMLTSSRDSEIHQKAAQLGAMGDVEAHGKVKVDDRLAAELFQIVAEGLSNVRRHAFCRDARVEISCKNSSLLLQIKNSRPRPNPVFERNDGSDNVKTFRPHSIAERAASLGGDTRVFVDEMNYTVVSVGIPL